MIPLNCWKLEKAEKHVECWERALLLLQLPGTCPRAGLENTEEGFSTCALQYLKIAITLHSPLLDTRQHKSWVIAAQSAEQTVHQLFPSSQHRDSNQFSK